MHSSSFVPFVFAFALNLQLPYCSAQEIEDLRRLYDFTAVSEANPVLARIEPCGIEIPLSEFKAFMATDGPLEPNPRALTLDEKHKYLDRLIDDHLFLWNAYEKKWDQKEGVVGMVNSTRNMMLMETLSQQEVLSKAKTPEEISCLASELVDRCFAKSDVIVSNESYEELKEIVKRLPSEASTPSEKTDVDKSKTKAELPTQTLARPLATTNQGTITIGDFLKTYNETPLKNRPGLDDQANVISILKLLMKDTLLVAEAKERGLDKTREFREGLQLNRNVVTRFYAQDRVTDIAVARMKAPDGPQRVKKWYEEHLKDRYTHKDEAGNERTVSFDTEQESIANDYFDVLRDEVRLEEAQALRKDRLITIVEPLLDTLVVSSNSSVGSAESEAPTDPTAKVSGASAQSSSSDPTQRPN